MSCAGVDNAIYVRGKRYAAAMEDDIAPARRVRLTGDYQPRKVNRCTCRRCRGRGWKVQTRKRKQWQR
jgi:hypothetical protein